MGAICKRLPHQQEGALEAAPSGSRLRLPRAGRTSCNYRPLIRSLPHCAARSANPPHAPTCDDRQGFLCATQHRRRRRRRRRVLECHYGRRPFGQACFAAGALHVARPGMSYANSLPRHALPAGAKRSKGKREAMGMALTRRGPFALRYGSHSSSPAMRVSRRLVLC